MFGPERLDLDNRRELERFFVGWSTESFITFDMSGTPTIISAIDLSVANYLSRSVGLPNFQLYTIPSANVIDPDQTNSGAMPVEVYFLNNEDFAQNDTTVRNVTLRLQSPITIRFVLLRWTFTGLYNVSTLGITEIRMCGDDQPAFTREQIQFQTPSSESVILLPSADVLAKRSLTLTCTVSNPGSFTWQWRMDGKLLTSANIQVLGTDATRTSLLMITDFDTDDAGVYTCSVFKNIALIDNAVRNFVIQFPRKLTAIVITLIYHFLPFSYT